MWLTPLHKDEAEEVYALGTIGCFLKIWGGHTLNISTVIDDRGLEKKSSFRMNRTCFWVGGGGITH